MINLSYAEIKAIRKYFFTDAYPLLVAKDNAAYCSAAAKMNDAYLKVLKLEEVKDES